LFDAAGYGESASGGMSDTGSEEAVMDAGDAEAKTIEPIEAESASRGSTGRTSANSQREEVAMNEAKADPSAGREVPITMSDPRWPASGDWVKMARNIDGVEIHYVYNVVSKIADDWKFVK
jgi:hypothetical protein